MRRAVTTLQTNCALGAVMLSSPLAIYLPVSAWQASERLRRYSRNGSILAALGIGLMYAFVSHMSMNVFVAQMIVVPVIMAVVSYFFHRYATFGDREIRQCSGRRYMIVRFGGMGVSKVSFILMYGMMGVQYLLACVLILIGLAWPTYKLNRDWVFDKEIYTPAKYYKYRGMHGAVPPTFR